jgi:hypothetical protein
VYECPVMEIVEERLKFSWKEIVGRLVEGSNILAGIRASVLPHHLPAIENCHTIFRVSSFVHFLSTGNILPFAVVGSVRCMLDNTHPGTRICLLPACT